MTQLTIQAPAKVNLCLEVLGRRPDGYHEVRTVLQAVDLADWLTIEPAATLTLQWDPMSSVRESEVPTEENLVLRAARSIQEQAGVGGGAHLLLHKAIPVAAGLGGGSSDAAATLLGLRRIWGLALSDQRLATIAASLGSDVPFFLRSGTALGSGRGEVIQGLPAPQEEWAVISAPGGPPQAGKTARLYQLLTPAHYAQTPYRTEELVRRIRDNERVSDALYNIFEAVADDVYPEYAAHREAFVASGAHNVLLAGAGPSLFSLVAGEASAVELRDRMAGHGYSTYAVRLLPARSIEGLLA